MPRLPHNIEPSRYRTGEYIAYDPRGYVWYVTKSARDWFARPAHNNPARDLGARVVGPTLTAVAQSIANRSGGSTIRPF